MEKFTFTNAKGDSIIIEYGTEYILKEYNGLSEAEIIATSSRGYQQIGRTLNETNMGIRIIDLKFYISTTTMALLYEKRRLLSKYFNPLLGPGTLKYENNYITKKISVITTKAPTPLESMGQLQLFSVELTAHNPFWYDDTETLSNMAGYEGGLTITNLGDYSTPVRIEFTGATVNPKITNTTTGEFIKVEKILVAGEKLVINTEYGNKTVMFTDTLNVSSSAYNLITNDSSFIQLGMGANILTFTADYGAPTIKIYWRNRFVGV